MLMLGAVLVATIFGNMTVLLANSDAQSRAHYEKLERVKQSLVRMEVTPKLQGRVIKYYEYMWRRQKSGTDGAQGNFITGAVDDQFATVLRPFCDRFATDFWFILTSRAADGSKG